MRLDDALVPSLLRLLRPDLPETELPDRVARFRQRRGAEDYRVVAEAGVVRGAVWLEADVPGRRHLFTAGVASPALIAEACARARDLGTRQLDYRLEASDLSASLPGLGFVRRHVRIEYRTPLPELPDDAGTPLSWAIAPLAEAVEVLGRAAASDPDWDPDDDPDAALLSYLEDPVLTHGPECVQVASVDGGVAGIVVAQVNPRTWWSRITYMGVVPELRGRGLGTWVHRHGFAMMRAQGGLTYQGGTVEGNLAMVRLFERHRCRFLHRLEEWRAIL